MKKVVWGAVLIPLLATFAALWWKLPIFPGEDQMTKTDVWSVIGTLFSYLGVLFSAYAAYEVGALSKKYFAKTRFPEINSKLTAITTAMAKVASKRAIDLRPERFISQIPVSLGEIQRIPGHNMDKLLERAAHERLQLIEWLNDPQKKETAVNDATIYWDLFRTINQISEEIVAHLKEQEAR
ncbi:hypothetical protein J3P71_00680 [Rhizobium leguminosarum]|uniref:hypothetical protein n=1 Tax=Rhizobium leguminosarum TaxID=384 RepID=UPI001442296E|nr:hypothetical protein [Rhizobium leguminosarum]MBY5836004.1 hypothetical protein [Rhizobium leguminosarum]NKM79094.1 hypothetical protein [Rhizobium leguminosarum bv. viciae]QSZ08337.1 hypothetical protein J3P71_00680 [Rhizobium leguminosarum]